MAGLAVQPPPQILVVNVLTITGSTLKNAENKGVKVWNAIAENSDCPKKKKKSRSGYFILFSINF
jgi:hypothetical protein